MKTKIGLALILVLIFAFSWFVGVAQNVDQENRVYIDLKLKSPDLVPQAVQLAIFYTDPAPMFKYYMSVQSPSNKYKDIDLECSWNQCFRGITGDNLYLITMEPQTYSTGSEGKLWVVTKAVRIAKRPVCWSIPLTVTRGEEYQVLLSPKNRIDLEDYYNKLIKK